jgi:hypothetical protein
MASAVLGDLSRRRWWPLAEAVTTDRLQTMFEIAAAEIDSRAAVAQQHAATLAHVVLGRVAPLLVCEGRAWDTGLENLWVHTDSEGAIDWVGVLNAQLRALPEDSALGGAVMSAATHVPMRSGASEVTSMRRAQAPLS